MGWKHSNQKISLLYQSYVFVMIGLYAGLRREEILGLKWDCVPLADGGE